MAKPNTDNVKSTVTLIINGEGAKTSLKEVGTAVSAVTKELRALKEADNPALYKDLIAKKRALTEEYIRQKQAIGEVRSAWDKFKTQSATIAAGVLGGNIVEQAGRAIVSIAQQAKAAFMSYEKAAKGLQSATLMSNEVLSDLEQQAKKLGPQMGYTAEMYLEAATKIGSAKSELVGSSDAMKEMMESAMLFARAGKLDLPDAGESLSMMLNQFGKDAQEAKHFVDVMSQGFALGAAELNQVVDGMKYAGVAANTMGVSFGETNAVLQLFVKNGLTGEMAGTQLRAILLKLGAGADDTNPKVVGLMKALDNLGKKNLSVKQITEQFNTENVAGANILLQNMPLLQKWTKEIENKGAAEKMAAINMSALDYEAQRYSVTVNQLYVAIGEKLSGAFRGLYKWATEVLTTLREMVEDSDNFMDIVFGIVDVIGDLLVSIRELTVTMTGYGDAGKLAMDVTKGIGVVFKLVAAAVVVVINETATLIGYFDVLINSGKKVMNFFGSQFKINPAANMDNLMKNRQKNIDRVNSWFEEPAKKTETPTKKTTTQSPVKTPPPPLPPTDGSPKTGGDAGSKEKKKKAPTTPGVSTKTWIEATKDEMEAWNDVYDEAEKERKANLANLLKDLTHEYDLHYLEIEQKAAQGKFNEDDLREQRLQKELDFLQKKKEFTELYGEDTLNVEREIAKKQEELQKAAADKKATDLANALAFTNKVFDEQADLLKGKEANQLISQELLNVALLDNEAARLGAQLNLLKAFGKETTEIEAQITKNHIAQNALKKENDKESAQKRTDLLYSFADASGAILDMVASNTEEMAGFQKAVALAKIAIDSGVAISAAVAAATSTSLTPIDMAIKIAGYVALIATNIAKARTIISSSDTPSAPTFAKKATGGFSDFSSLYGDNSGQPQGFTSGPTLFNLGRRSYIAGEAGKEYIISNPMLKNPVIANIASMLEMYRKGQPMPTGGTGGNTSDLQVLIPLLQEISAKLNQRQTIQFNYSEFEKYRDFIDFIREDAA
ncbi:phage tail tape measure protein [Runella limosa]|uniref:phage tail tape measure protein n=1 Tax=Runella limosa TaxID=370978 RepID=UPI00040E2F18|nr:phage tail tape measure protein [Runella limosa]